MYRHYIHVQFTKQNFTNIRFFIIQKLFQPRKAFGTLQLFNSYTVFTMLSSVSVKFLLYWLQSLFNTNKSDTLSFCHKILFFFAIYIIWNTTFLTWVYNSFKINCSRCPIINLHKISREIVLTFLPLLQLFNLSQSCPSTVLYLSLIHI